MVAHSKGNMKYKLHANKAVCYIYLFEALIIIVFMIEPTPIFNVN